MVSCGGGIVEKLKERNMDRTLMSGVDAFCALGDEPPALRRGVDLWTEGRVLAGVGRVPDAFEADHVISGSRLLALPALHNAHAHAAMTLVRGFAEDLPFSRWLNERVWVAEKALQEEDVRWGAALAACEMIRSGTVGMADHYFWMEQTARVVQDSGMKALLAWCHFGRGDDQEVGGATLQTKVDAARRWHGAADGRIRAALGPHSPYMCPPEVLSEMGAAARELGVALHLHLSESSEQVARSRARYGKTPVEELADLGLLDQPILCAHCIAVSPEEMAALARPQVFVAHTPKTYLKLAMEMAPLEEQLAAGMQVALGTDGPASGADLNLLEVLRLTGLVHKGRAGRAEVLPVATLLHMACRTGARALGFEDSGVLRPGAAADIMLLDRSGPHWAPDLDPLAGAVYASHPSDVRHVMCDGRLLLDNGQLTTLDEEWIIAEASRRARRITGAAGGEAMRRYQG